MDAGSHARRKGKIQGENRLTVCGRHFVPDEYVEQGCSHLEKGIVLSLD